MKKRDDQIINVLIEGRYEGIPGINELENKHHRLDLRGLLRNWGIDVGREGKDCYKKCK